MKKYAFIENVPGLSVDGYMKTFDDGEWLNQIAGFDGSNQFFRHVLIESAAHFDSVDPGFCKSLCFLHGLLHVLDKDRVGVHFRG